MKSVYNFARCDYAVLRPRTRKANTLRCADRFIQNYAMWHDRPSFTVVWCEAQHFTPLQHFWAVDERLCGLLEDPVFVKCNDKRVSCWNSTQLTHACKLNLKIPAAATLGSDSNMDASAGSIRIALRISVFFFAPSVDVIDGDEGCKRCRCGDRSGLPIWGSRIISAAIVCGVESGLLYIFPLCAWDAVSFLLGTSGWQFCILINKFLETSKMASTLASIWIQKINFACESHGNFCCTCLNLDSRAANRLEIWSCFVLRSPTCTPTTSISRLRSRLDGTSLPQRRPEFKTRMSNLPHV